MMNVRSPLVHVPKQHNRQTHINGLSRFMTFRLSFNDHIHTGGTRGAQRILPPPAPAPIPPPPVGCWTFFANVHFFALLLTLTKTRASCSRVKAPSPPPLSPRCSCSWCCSASATASKETNFAVVSRSAWRDIRHSSSAISGAWH